ncbi:unnamed protein product [Effrenium voratum]|nr:unnamed protein product [Effrenium voratum]
MAVVGRGLLRRQEDASELCTESDLARMAKLRALNQPKELMKYGMQLDTVAGRSQAIYSLVGMGPPGIKRAEEMVAAPWMEKGQEVMHPSTEAMFFYFLRVILAYLYETDFY